MNGRKLSPTLAKALRYQPRKGQPGLTKHQIQLRLKDYKQRMELQPSIASTSSQKEKNEEQTNAMRASQRFDYFLVLDFEATCQDGGPLLPYQEIIEFPCAKLNSRTWEVESRFRHFVRPTTNPELTPFCSQLTGVIQEMVDNQPTLSDVLKRFDEWLYSESLLPSGNFAFVTCGDWDLQLQLPKEAAIKEIELPWYFSRWINVKKAFAAHRGFFPAGMKQLLKELQLTQTGRPHSGIDDVANICEIVRALAADGCVLGLTTGQTVDAPRFFFDNSIKRSP